MTSASSIRKTVAVATDATFIRDRFKTALDAGYQLRPMDGQWELPGWLRITVGFDDHMAGVLRAIEVSLASPRGAGR